jgi:hypothetical protein
MAPFGLSLPRPSGDLDPSSGLMSLSVPLLLGGLASIPSDQEGTKPSGPTQTFEAALDQKEPRECLCCILYFTV